MGVAGIKWGPYPSTIHSFSINLNEEALLKVSFKNIDKFQSCPFSKTTFFSKRALKVQNFLKNQNFFFISGRNFVGLFNGILFVLILSVVIEAQKEMLPSLFQLATTALQIQINILFYITQRCDKLQWWPIETDQQCFLLCLYNH